MKKLITASAVAVALVVAPAAGVAGAAESTPPTANVAHPRAHRAARALGVVADTIGISPRALVDALRGGKSVADVAKDHGVDPQKVIDAVVGAADKKVDEAVANGKLDADRAATIKDRLPDRITRIVNATGTPGGGAGA
jgi:hypothetical protein